MNDPKVVDSICLIDDDGDVSHCFVVVTIGKVTRLHVGEFDPKQPVSGVLASITTVRWKSRYDVGGIRDWMKVVLAMGEEHVSRLEVSIKEDQKVLDTALSRILSLKKVLKL